MKNQKGIVYNKGEKIADIHPFDIPTVNVSPMVHTPEDSQNIYKPFMAFGSLTMTRENQERLNDLLKALAAKS